MPRQEERSARRIYVGNIPPDIREDDVRDKFKKYGHIEYIDLKSRGGGPVFAFVDYEDARWDWITLLPTSAAGTPRTRFAHATAIRGMVIVFASSSRAASAHAAPAACQSPRWIVMAARAAATAVAATAARADRVAVDIAAMCPVSCSACPSQYHRRTAADRLVAGSEGPPAQRGRDLLRGRVPRRHGRRRVRASRGPEDGAAQVRRHQVPLARRRDVVHSSEGGAGGRP